MEYRNLREDYIYDGNEGRINLSYKTVSGYTYKTSKVSHRHEEIEVYYIHKGNHQFNVVSRTYNLKAGDVIVIPANLEHMTSEISSDPRERTVLLFDEKFIEPLFKINSDFDLKEIVSGKEKVYRPCIDENAPITIIFKYLRDEIKTNSPGYLSMMRTSVLQLFIRLSRNEIINSVNDKKERVNKCDIDEVMKYLNDNYASEFNLNELSQKFYMNPSALSRSFKKEVGIPPVNYVNNCRIEAAKGMLEEGNASVAEISVSLGFNTSTYFERLFKKYTGMTPTQYKKTMKNGNLKRV